ncbi:hypothetical protein C0J52_25490 [Blattella germanica]|nr:hypothetical protein C0J52_25490 [Blattella germanica]
MQCNRVGVDIVMALCNVQSMIIMPTFKALRYGLYKHFPNMSIGLDKLSIESITRTTNNGVRFLKTEPVDDLLIEEASSVVVEDDSEVMINKEEELQKKRNKSRLNAHHRNILHGNMPYTEPMAWFHETVKYKQKMYGRYGQSSGVLPGVMWPTKEDLEDMKEYERVAHPLTLQEMVQKEEQRRKEEQDKIKAREEELLTKFSKLEQWKKEVKANAAKKLAAAEAAKAKKDRLVEEVRRHFGFKIDPRDDRFKEMLEQKEKEERKLAKEAKRKERYELAIARLQAQSHMKVEGTETVKSDIQEMVQTSQEKTVT